MSEDTTSDSTTSECSTAESLRRELNLSEQRLVFRNRQVTDLEERRGNLRDYLVREAEDLGEHHTQAIAEIMDITLEKSAEVEVTVKFKLSITGLPMDTDLDSLVDDMTFDVSYNGYGDVESEDYDVEYSSASGIE